MAHDPHTITTYQKLVVIAAGKVIVTSERAERWFLTSTITSYQHLPPVPCTRHMGTISMTSATGPREERIQTGREVAYCMGRVRELPSNTTTFGIHKLHICHAPLGLNLAARRRAFASFTFTLQWPRDSVVTSA